MSSPGDEADDMKPPARGVGSYVCPGCGKAPCILLNILEGLTEHSTYLLQYHPTNTNAHSRKELYKKATQMLHGCLGKGVRRQLPACIVEEIRKWYPDKDNEYMGYKKK